MLTRLPERARTDRADLYAVLDAGLICHLGLVGDGAPVVLPTGYARVDDTVYLHGSTRAGYLRFWTAPRSAGQSLIWTGLSMRVRCSTIR